MVAVVYWLLVWPRCRSAPVSGPTNSPRFLWLAALAPLHPSPETPYCQTKKSESDTPVIKIELIIIMLMLVAWYPYLYKLASEKWILVTIY